MKDTTPLDGDALKDVALPRTLREIMVATDQRVAGGEVDAYTPLPTGFRELDEIIGGGMKQGELILLGGAQGTGKTIWCLQVARNVARNRWKYIKKRHHEELDDVREEANGNDPAKLLELEELRSRVADAIEALPERQRTAFRLHDVEGFKATEIAEMLGVSDGTVRANVHHARRELRKRLEPYQTDRA